MFEGAQSAALAGRFHRIVASGCAALVLALSIFAASPVAHSLLHDTPHHAHPVADDACAVVLFASGVALPVGPIAITPPEFVARSVSPLRAAEVFLVPPRYLRQPERGPPVSWFS